MLELRLSIMFFPSCRQLRSVDRPFYFLQKSQKNTKITLLIKYMVTIEDFAKLDIRVGKIIEVNDFPEAKKPAYKLKIDFGSEIGIKKSTAQLVKNYSKEDLVGKLILGVVNFPPRQIGPEVSEVLTLGVPDENGECILITPDKNSPIGGRLY